MSARVVGVGGEKTRVENVADAEAIETDAETDAEAIETDESDTESTKANAEFAGTDTESIASTKTDAETTKTDAETTKTDAEPVKAGAEPVKDLRFRRCGCTLGYTDPPRWPSPHQTIKRSLFGSEVPSPQSLFY